MGRITLGNCQVETDSKTCASSNSVATPTPANSWVWPRRWAMIYAGHWRTITVKVTQRLKFTRPAGPAATPIVIALLLLWAASTLFIDRSLAFARSNGQVVDTPTTTPTATSTPAATPTPTPTATATSTPLDICARTVQVRDAILDQLERLDRARTCDSVTAVDLSTIRMLRLWGEEIAGLNAGDFQGLSSMRTLDLGNNSLTSLPSEVFDGLSELEELDLGYNALTSLHEDVFDGLSKLEELDLGYNALISLHVDVFDGLSNLRTLHLGKQRPDLLTCGRL